MSREYETEGFESRLAVIASGYERLVALTRELHSGLAEKGTAELTRMVAGISRLSEEIQSADTGVAEMLTTRKGLRRHPLVLRIIELLEELQELTAACMPRLEAVRAATREEISNSHKARSALSGYRTGGPARGGHFSDTF